jgi:hypothetical protein
MFARLTTFEGPPEGIEAGVRVYREEVLPWLKDSTGFRGWIVLRDPSGRKTTSVTFWADEATMRDEAAGGGALRDEVVASIGITMTSLEYLEVAVAEALTLDE